MAKAHPRASYKPVVKCTKVSVQIKIGKKQLNKLMHVINIQSKKR